MKSKKMTKIYPVLLAGGAGTRLWPLSRKSHPKQFSNFVDDNTLFQQSALRLNSSEIVKFEPHITMTNSDLRFIVSEQLCAIGIDPGTILIEPAVKNTGPAILAASLFAMKNDPNAILLVVPSDHFIPDTEAFHKAVQKGLVQVKNEKIVTFGILPTRPETGYGYLKISNADGDDPDVKRVSCFVEKPDQKNVERILQSEDYLWNAGIFLFKAKDMIAAYEKFDPITLNLVYTAVSEAKADLGFLRLDAEAWSELLPQSIDYAIMEKADNLVSIVYKSKWLDLGSWDIVWRENKKDDNGNVVSDAAHAIDCNNSLLRSEDPSLQLVGLGLENIVAIATKDAILVAHRDRSQHIKKAVNFLKENAVAQADIFPKDYRPWGWYENLIISDVFQVKQICVNPGGALSLQTHKYRSEHWIVVEGTAEVTIDDEVKLVEAGHSVYVPLGSMHRLANPSKYPLVLIEVQTGQYLREDDIIRYEDLYGRA